MMRGGAVLSAILLVACVAPAARSGELEPQAPAAEAASWRPVDAGTGKIADVEGLEQLARDFPDSGAVRLRLLNAQLPVGDAEGAVETLTWLRERGYVFGSVASEQIALLLTGAAPDWMAEALPTEAEPIERSEVVLTVPEFAGLVESVAREPKDDRMVVTSVSERAIFAIKPYAGWDGYRPHDAANISGIAVDLRNFTIWMAAGRIDGGEGTSGEFHGLIALPYSASEEVRIAAPESVSLSDLVIGGDGSIYASDPIDGGVYVKLAGEGSLSTLVAPGTFRSPQGLALSADGKLLYVSDYRYGVAIVDLATRHVSRLMSDVPIILDGVDGLWRYGDELIAMQNGTSPMRISAFRLSDDGRHVIARRIIEQAHRDWTEPLSGTIDGDRLLYVANGQWDRFVAGQPAQDKPALPTRIRSLPLSR